MPAHQAAICRKLSLKVGVRRAGAGTVQKLKEQIRERDLVERLAAEIEEAERRGEGEK